MLSKYLRSGKFPAHSLASASQFRKYGRHPFSTAATTATTHTQTEWYNQASDNCVSFWREAAKDIEWDKFPETIFNPHDKRSQLNYSWYNDGELNLTNTALDRHINNGLGNNNAIIHDSPITNTIRYITYNELYEQVELMSTVLLSRGVTVGDRVLIYMPMIPEAIIAMYACARIGAIHSVVFGGFAAPELAKRIIESNPKIIISASGSKEGYKKIIEYKPLLDEAIEISQNFKKTQNNNSSNNINVSLKDSKNLKFKDLSNIDNIKCIIYQRKNICQASLITGRDEDWNDVINKTNERTKAVSVNANHPLYILYTSGTTGTPKGIIRECGGHTVALRWTMEHFYSLQPGDTTFFASDIGWVVGHSYIVYAPLLQGCTCVMFEGKPIGTPDSGTFWRMVEQHNIKTMFAAPTAFRAIKKEDPLCKSLSKYNLESLKYLFLAGERCDPNTLQWLQNHLPKNIDISDHWWQTETGWPITGRMMGEQITNKLPNCIGAGGQPMPGMYLSCVKPDLPSNDTNAAATTTTDEEPDFIPLSKIRTVSANETGEFVLKLPLPPGTLGGLWNDGKRCHTAYLDKYPGYYITGDTGHIDENGNVHIMSRVDDLINVAGHRLSTASMETVLSEHPKIAESCVIAVNDAIKGQVPVGVVVLKSIDSSNDNNMESNNVHTIERETIEMIRKHIGPVASYKQTIIVNKLPKTRSGKILRRSLREIYIDGKIAAFPATIEDASALDEFKYVLDRINQSKNAAKL